MTGVNVVIQRIIKTVLKGGVIGSFLLFASLTRVLADLQPVQKSSEPLVEDSLSRFLQEIVTLRDPFRVPESRRVSQEQERVLQPIEQYPLDRFKVVGILTGPDRLRALVAAPDGKTFPVGERSRIGRAGGVVQKILEDRVVVKQKTIDPSGVVKWEQVDLPFASEQSAEEKPGEKLDSGLRVNYP